MTRCPVCDGELLVEIVPYFEHCGEDGVAYCKGYCEKCEQKFEWEDVFIFSFSRNIEYKD